MEDYKEEIKNLVMKYYTTSGKDHHKILRTTSEILREVTGVIPSKPITEHEIYEVMKELEFETEQNIIFQEVCINEGDEKNGIQPEYDKVEVGRVLSWAMFNKI